MPGSTLTTGQFSQSSQDMYLPILNLHNLPISRASVEHIYKGRGTQRQSQLAGQALKCQRHSRAGEKPQSHAQNLEQTVDAACHQCHPQGAPFPRVQ